MAGLDREEWKDIAGFEGIYEVSNHGRIRNRTGKILRQGRCGGGRNYYCIDLCKDGNHRTMLVHRIVAKAFIPNPDELLEINHKDCDGRNNHIDNLEWCDRKYNINYGDRTLKAIKAIEKKVICIETGKVYESGTKAAKELGLQKSKISLCCHGKRKTTGGFRWSFA